MPNSGPTASVIMAMYNGAATVAEAIASVQAQTSPDWELIVVDDASSDGSTVVVDGLARQDPRIRPIRADVNSGGPARPRNAGLRSARGRFCFIIDQDDLWSPTKLEKQLAVLDAGAFGLVYSDAFVRRRGRPDEKYSNLWGPMADGDVREALLARCFIPALTVGFRREVIREVGDFDERLAGVDDYDYWLRIALAGHRVGYVDEPLATWEDRETSLSRHRVQQLRRVQRCLAGHRDAHPEYESVITEHLDRVREELLAVLVRQRPGQARRSWLLAALPLVRRRSDLREIARALR